MRTRAAASAAALLVAVVAGGWWVTHPDDLGGVGSAVALPVEVGQPALVGMFAYPQEGSVDLVRATARVRDGSAAADVRVRHCVGPTGGTAIGSLRERVEQACEQSSAAGGQRLSLPTPENGYAQLVLEVVPREAGDVVIDGLAITYRSGLRRGTVAAGTVVTVLAR